MRSRLPIDPGLGEVFSVQEALLGGTTRDRLRGRDLERPFHAVRSRGPVPAVRAYVPRLREGDRFSHTTAAMLWGAPIPRAAEKDLHVSAARAQRPRAEGCIGHVSTATAVVWRKGLPVSDPARTVLECATVLTLDQVIALCDYFVLEPRILDPLDLRPYVTFSDLGEQLARQRGLGVRVARGAHKLSREGVESPMETRLRLLLARADLPAPVCGYELLRPGRTPVGWFDLAWPEHRVIVEYDGDQHRTSNRQYELDIRRYDQAADLGWRVIRVRQHGIRSAPHETIARVRAALQ